MPPSLKVSSEHLCPALRGPSILDVRMLPRSLPIQAPPSWLHRGPLVMACGSPVLDSLGPYFHCLPESFVQEILSRLLSSTGLSAVTPAYCQDLCSWRPFPPQSHLVHLQKSCLCFCPSGLGCSASITEAGVQSPETQKKRT